MRKRFIMCFLSAFLGTVITGCSSVVRPFGDNGVVDLHADEKGLRAWYDGLNGLIESSKNDDPHQLTNHYKLRGEQERTIRHGLSIQLGKGEQHE